MKRHIGFIEGVAKRLDYNTFGTCIGDTHPTLPKKQDTHTHHGLLARPPPIYRCESLPLKV
jgi:hypothetical protein